MSMTNLARNTLFALGLMLPLAALAQVGGRDMSKEETEELWRS